jgi:D-alanyl-D-alanine carboxypeptidase
MTRPARGVLSASIALAMAAGVLLAPARAQAAPGPSRTAAPAAQRIDPGELQQLLDQIVAAGAPGAAAWIRDEHGVLTATSGVADLRTGRPMRADLHYRAGSVAKSLVATVVLQLVAEGRLSLQDTVARWLPGILPYGDQVTIEQLLRHTSGVPDYAPELVVALLSGPRQARFRRWTPQELVGLVADQPPDFPPGVSCGRSGCATPSSRSTLMACPAPRHAATACRSAPRGSCWRARCWTSPSTTPRHGGRQAT